MSLDLSTNLQYCSGKLEPCTWMICIIWQDFCCLSDVLVFDWLHLISIFLPLDRQTDLLDFETLLPLTLFVALVQIFLSPHCSVLYFTLRITLLYIVL